MQSEKFIAEYAKHARVELANVRRAITRERNGYRGPAFEYAQGSLLYAVRKAGHYANLVLDGKGR